MKEIENAVRSIVADGLLWGACKYVMYMPCVNFFTT